MRLVTTGAVASALPLGTVLPSGAVVDCTITPTGNTQGDLSGQLLSNAPKLRLTFSLDYSVPINDDWKAFIVPQVRYASKQRFDLLRLPTSYVGDKTYVDLNFGFRADRYNA